MATTYPYVTGQVFTEAGPEGKWQTEVMSPATGAADTVTVNAYGVVDGEGRPAVLYPSVARTATPTSYAIQSRGATGLAVTIVSTAVAATPSVVVTIDGYNPGSNTWYNILTSAAVTDGSTTRRLVIYPTVTAAANLAVATTIPETIRVVVTHGDSDSITYSVSLDWMP